MEVRDAGEKVHGCTDVHMCARLVIAVIHIAAWGSRWRALVSSRRRRVRALAGVLGLRRRSGHRARTWRTRLRGTLTWGRATRGARWRATRRARTRTASGRRTAAGSRAGLRCRRAGARVTTRWTAVTRARAVGGTIASITAAGRRARAAALSLPVDGSK